MADQKCSWTTRIPGLIAAAALGCVFTSRAHDWLVDEPGVGTSEKKGCRGSRCAATAIGAAAAVAVVATGHAIVTAGAKAVVGK